MERGCILINEGLIIQQELGLTEKEATIRLGRFGNNEIKRAKKISPLKILFSQFTSPLILILFTAAAFSTVIGFLPGQEPHILDTVLILIIVFASGIIGFFQNYKAEKTIEALQKMAIPKAKVIRDGKEKVIDVAELVPRDLILLESGDMVPADAKLLSSFNLKIDESILTGESQAVEKEASSEVFMNTFINVGSAKAIVTKTGMQTKVGEIASKLQQIKEEKTPFEIEMSRFSKKVFWGIATVTAGIFLVSFLKFGLYQSLLIAISLSVAAIPEGLPAVITLALAIGAKAMFGKKALIKKLTVTESVGAIAVICTDKTGTLTKNEMTVTKLFFNNKVFGLDINKEEINNMKQLFVCAALCNDSNLGYDEDGNKKYLGDNTEIALRKMSGKLGFTKENLEKEYTRINEIAFTSERKMMSIVTEYKNSKYFLYTKGAPEEILKKCDRVFQNGKITKLEYSTKENILNKDGEFSQNTLRVLGFAYKEIKNKKDETEENMVWLGLQAMIDPPREGIKQALNDSRTAGIRVIMLTGDSSMTAKAVADEIGLQSSEIIKGEELDKLSDDKLKKNLDAGVNIFARISPFHKLRILEILKKNNKVAMTGDGVNDALALKRADVGIAMEVRGTEVAKEASDMILLDDNFATIISAVKEGRRIFDNIRKFINYLFVSNLAEVGVIFMAAIFLNLKEPILLPAQILWINLLTDGLPALALGVDPARTDIMHEAPRKKQEPIINKRLMCLIGTIGIKKTLVLFGTFFLLLPLGLPVARTALFTGFILYEFVRIASIRYQEKLGWFSNKWLIAALIGSVLLQLLIVYSPFNTFFHTVPLGLYVWTILTGGIVVGYISAIALTNMVLKFVKD